jgi:hypothetical protein
MALHFHEAAVRCGVEDKDPLGAPVIPLCPMIVCFAFASELYLKSLAGLRGGLGPTDRHKLNMLFGRLSDQVKDEIAGAYEARTGRPRTTLESDLNELAKAFVEWRYVYEADGRQLHTNLLIAFALAVYETVRKLRADWEISAYVDERIRSTADNTSMTVANLGGGTFVHVVDGTGTLNRPGS